MKSTEKCASFFYRRKAKKKRKKKADREEADDDDDDDDDDEGRGTSSIVEAPEQGTDAPHPSEPGRTKFFKRVIKRLTQGGLRYASYYSIQRDEVYVLIGAKYDRLAQQADILDFQVHLHAARLGACLEAGMPKYNIAPIRLGTEVDGLPVSKYAPCDHIYAKYDTNEDLVPLYSTMADDVTRAPGREAARFRSMQRIKLVTNILQASRRYGGCEMPLQKRILQGKLLAFLPLHDGPELAKLTAHWKETPFHRVASYPFDEYKDYFGEAAGLYMRFVAFNAEMFAWLGVPGCVAFVVVEVETSSRAAVGIVRAAYVVGLVIWCAVYSALWRRVQQQAALKWGTTGFEQQEHQRPQHKGPVVNSPITGASETYYHPRKRRAQVWLGAAVSVVIVAIDVVFIVAVTLWRDAGSGDPSPAKANAAAAILSIGIQVFTFVYKAVAKKLTDAENWRTETEYADQLVLKTVIFNFINSYFALLLTLFKPCARPDRCVALMRTNLLYIFVLAMLVNVGVSTLLPKLARWYALYTEGGLSASMSAAEWQYVLLEYDETLDAIQAYMASALQFGYVALFSGAAPIVSLLAAGANALLVRLEGLKYMTGFRRIEPRGAEDIGKFEAVATVLGVLAPITNGAIVINLSRPFATIDPLSQQRYVYVVSALVAIVVQVIIRAATASGDPDVQMQLDRQEFIRDKVIKHVADEEELLTIDAGTADFQIDERADAYFDDLTSVIAGGRGHAPPPVGTEAV